MEEEEGWRKGHSFHSRRRWEGTVVEMVQGRQLL